VIRTERWPRAPDKRWLELRTGSAPQVLHVGMAFLTAPRWLVGQDAGMEFIAGALFGVGLCLLWSWASAHARS
jgi:hypothetical protein